MIAKQRIRIWVLTVSVLLLSSASALILAELGLRLYFFRSLYLPKAESGLRQPHPLLGWKLRSKASIVVHTPDYTVHVKTNSKGFRDVEHKYRPRPGVFRILILGDSFMEAYQVAMEESLPRRLEQALKNRSVEVINLGVGGYGTTQEFLLLKEVGVKFRPNLVVLVFPCINDVRNNSRDLEKALWKKEMIKTFGRPYARSNPISGNLEFTKPDFERSQRWAEMMRRREKEKSYLQRTAIAYGVRHLRNPMMKQLALVPSYDPNILYGPFLRRFHPQSAANAFSHAEYQRMWNEAWRITQRIVVHMRDFAKRHGAEFMLLLVPSKVQVDSSYLRVVIKSYPRLDFDFAKPNRRIGAFAADHDILVLDLLPAFRTADQAGARLYHKLRDRHWNAEGHAFATSELVSYLDEHRLIPPQGRPTRGR